MRYNGVRLEKGMYQEHGRTFSHVLESIDPSNQYVGTPLEGLDAFQRQLKRFDIKVKGAQSDTVENSLPQQNQRYFSLNMLQEWCSVVWKNRI